MNKQYEVQAVTVMGGVYFIRARCAWTARKLMLHRQGSSLLDSVLENGIEHVEHVDNPREERLVKCHSAGTVARVSCSSPNC